MVPNEERPGPQFLSPAKDPQLPGFATLDPINVSGYAEIGNIERNTLQRSTRVVSPNESRTQYPWGEEHFEEIITHETNDDHPENTSVNGKHIFTVTLKNRTLVWDANTTFRSDRKNFYYNCTRRLMENGKLIRDKTWQDTIPRDFQ